MRHHLAGAAAWLLAAQDMSRRYDGLRRGTGKLSFDKFVEQAVPVFIWTFIAGMVLIGLGFLIRRIRDGIEFDRIIQRSGITDEERTRLAQMARAARVRPRTRILRSVTCFEQVASSVLSRRLARGGAWDDDVIDFRAIAHKLGFAATDTPPDPGASQDIGILWPVDVSWTGSTGVVAGFIATDTNDRFTVRVHDPEGFLPELRPGDALTIRPRITGATPRGFECDVVRAWNEGPITVVRLVHAPPPRSVRTPGGGHRAGTQGSRWAVTGFADGGGRRRRPFLGVFFDCCGVYQRVYRELDGQCYRARCPRCLRVATFTVAPGGTRHRFFRAR